MLNLAGRLTWRLRRIHVYALVGAAGTGKSFRAQLIAGKHNIDLIIDDGLLIRGEQIIAGRSAKKEKAILAAIKTALFVDQEHMLGVRKALAGERYSRLLIIGTSEEMVRKIAARLGLRSPVKIIKIEEVASQDELNAATRARETGGKHIIPVPTVELRKDYGHLIVDSVRVLFRKGLRRKRGSYEKTIVRPDYGRKGRVSLSETALRQMVQHCVEEYESAVQIRRIVVITDPDGFVLRIELSIPYGVQVSGSLHNLRTYIHESIERYTGILIHEVSITVIGITEPSGRAAARAGAPLRTRAAARAAARAGARAKKNV